MVRSELSEEQKVNLQLLFIAYLKKNLTPPKACDVLTNEERREAIEAYLKLKESQA